MTLVSNLIFFTFCIQQLPSYLEAYRGLDYNKKLERDLLKNYNRKNRPVKSSDTVIQVAVQLMITHVENVDQKEQTIHLHGQIYSSWKDEYMVWESSKYNNTQYILIEAYNLWQPALTLTNNAKSSSWNLHLSSVPAIITSDGTVRVTGVFTFHVTCSFDYSNYPYDEQECPIAITEWIYDASKVNLSDSEVDAEIIKPLIRLSFDPIRNESKKHSSGWEITDTWKKHLYWGPDGVDEKIPNTVQLDWYWSVLEFGIKLKRHEPYFWSIIMFPTLISIILILISFWTEDIQLAYHLNITTIIFLGLHAWDIISRLPPGNGSVPKIVYLYGTHLSISLATYFLHVLMMHLVQTLPDDEVKFPVRINEIVAFLKGTKIFQIKGISFDPQSFSQHEEQIPTNDLIDMSSETGPETDPEIDSAKPKEQIEMPSEEALMSSNETSPKLLAAEAEPLTSSNSLTTNLTFLRRILFLLFSIIYLIAIYIVLW